MLFSWRNSSAHNLKRYWIQGDSTPKGVKKNRITKLVSNNRSGFYWITLWQFCSLFWQAINENFHLHYLFLQYNEAWWHPRSDTCHKWGSSIWKSKMKNESLSTIVFSDEGQADQVFWNTIPKNNKNWTISVLVRT